MLQYRRYYKSLSSIVELTWPAEWSLCTQNLDKGSRQPFLFLFQVTSSLDAIVCSDLHLERSRLYPHSGNPSRKHTWTCSLERMYTGERSLLQGTPYSISSLWHHQKSEVAENHAVSSWLHNQCMWLICDDPPPARDKLHRSCQRWSPWSIQLS